MQDLYKELFKQSPIIQIITNSHNVICDINERFTRYFGYTCEDIKGQHISTLLADYKKTTLEIEQSSDYPNVWEVLTKKGECRFIAIETTKLNGHNLITAYDLTRDGFRARSNSINVQELKKYLINDNPIED